jgi:hypothetical protein
MLLKRVVFLFASDSAGGIVPLSWHNAGKTENVANIKAIAGIAPEQSRRFTAPFHIGILLQLVDQSENVADHPARQVAATKVVHDLRAEGANYTILGQRPRMV